MQSVSTPGIQLSGFSHDILPILQHNHRCPQPVPEQLWCKRDPVIHWENQFSWKNGAFGRFFALHQDKGRHFHPAIDEIIMACEAMGISIHTFSLSASSSGCYFSLRCALLATNFSPSPFTTTLLMQDPSIELLVLSGKVGQTF